MQEGKGAGAGERGGGAGEGDSRRAPPREHERSACSAPPSHIPRFPTLFLSAPRPSHHGLSTMLSTHTRNKKKEASARQPTHPNIHLHGHTHTHTLKEKKIREEGSPIKSKRKRTDKTHTHTHTRSVNLSSPSLLANNRARGFVDQKEHHERTRRELRQGERTP